MKFHQSVWAVLALAAAASPSGAVTNIIVNGSFEAGPLGSGGFVSWSKLNTPTGVFGSADVPATVIGYNNTDTYPTGAFGESVSPDNVLSASPDAVGSQAAYFVGDFSTNETIFQSSYLAAGIYRVGFSYYLPQNGINNPNNASFVGTVIGSQVVSTAITGSSPAQVWNYVSGTVTVASAGTYTTSFVYNSNGYPAKDIVVDRVFVIKEADVPPNIPPAPPAPPPTPTATPEPDVWMMMLVGFGFAGSALRRKKALAA